MATPAYAGCQFGILGVGSLGRALAVGLLTGPSPLSKPILLSSDGGATANHSTALSKTYGSKVALMSNVDVISKADVVLLCVPPEAVPAVLKGVALREKQVLISVAAMYPVAKLSAIVAPARAVRSLPMVSCEFHSSFTLVCFGEEWKAPDGKGCLNEKEVLEFFEVLGSVAHAEDDKQLDALGFAGLHQKSMLAFLQSIQQTLQHHGVPPELAAQTVSKQMSAVCADAVRAADTGPAEWDQLRTRGCRGELNQLVCDLLTGTGFFAAYRMALNVVRFGKWAGEEKAKAAMCVGGIAVAAGATVYALR